MTVLGTGLHIERFAQEDVKPHSRVQCSHTVTLDIWTYRQRNHQCKKNAMVKINDNPLCDQHAGKVLLEEALRDVNS